MTYLRTLAALALCSLPSFGAWSLVQRAVNYCGTSVTSCAVNITQPTAGNLLVAVAYSNGGAITSASGAGTWVHPASCSATASGGQTIDMAYSLAAGTGTSVTVNFSAGAPAGFGDLWIFEYTGGVAPFAFDKCALGSGTTTAVNGGSLTTAGANELAIAAATASAAFGASVAVAPAPWVTPTTMVNGQEIAAHALGFAATTTQAVFTASSAVTSAGVTIAFSDATAAAATRKRVVTLRGPTDAAAPAATAAVDFLAQAVADQYSSGTTAALNEGHPHGIPTNWGFYTGSFLADGNNPCASVTPCNPQMGYVIWGVAYADANGNPATNTRVQIKGCTTYWYDTVARTWTGSGPYNHPDDEDYQENYDTGPFTSNQRTEIDGSLSVKLVPGDVNHFFTPYSRVPFTMANWGGAVSVCQMRLVVDDAGLPDDRAAAKILGGVGGDFYPAITGPGIPHNPGIGGGKLKYITTSWRSFAMSTLSYSAIMALPAQPPLNLTGLNP